MNLYGFDMDGTLSEAISGAFPKNPRDKQLRPGVLERIQELQSQGHRLFVASNQGGCGVFNVEANQLKVGMWVVLDDSFARKISKIEDSDTVPGEYVILTFEDSENEYDFEHIANSEVVTVSFKTLSEAKQELEYLAELTGIDILAFCPAKPDLQGDTVYILQKGAWKRYTLENLEIKESYIGFRKPNPGMLKIIQDLYPQNYERSIFVGDRTEDLLAAHTAGFEYYQESEFFQS